MSGHLRRAGTVNNLIHMYQAKQSLVNKVLRCESIHRYCKQSITCLSDEAKIYYLDRLPFGNRSYFKQPEGSSRK